MGRTKETRNKNFTRPKKTGAAKRRRLKAQHGRLVELGVPESELGRKNAKEIRSMLRKPQRTAKQNAKKA